LADVGFVLRETAVWSGAGDLSAADGDAADFGREKSADQTRRCRLAACPVT
jgi:hypothetical protein